jgi:magnesium-transporting ATPase (P-type)
MAQVGNLFACQSENGNARGPRRWNNKYIWIGIAMEVAMIAATVYLPPLARAFNHIPIPPVYWLGLAGFAPILYLLEKGRKIFLHYACSVLRPRRHIEQTLL